MLSPENLAIIDEVMSNRIGEFLSFVNDSMMEGQEYLPVAQGEVDRLRPAVEAVKKARRAEPWTTYKIADGSLVWGEYEWVGELQFFEEVDEPVTLLKETWVCVSREQIVVGPKPGCPNCGGEMPVEDDDAARTFCSEACYEEDRASTLADRARDEAKFDPVQ